MTRTQNPEPVGAVWPRPFGFAQGKPTTRDPPTAMKQLRRRDQALPADPYRRAQRCALRYLALSEADFGALERERPGLVVIEGDALLVGQPRRQRIDLHYAFPDRDAFARQFPSMLQRLLPAARQEEAPLGFRLRLTDRTSRPYLEPVLRAHAFEVAREWMQMVLLELPAGGPPADEVAAGFVLRPVRPDDAEAIVHLEELVFPDPMLTADLAREAMRTAALYRVLEEQRSGALAGSLLAERRPPATGHIATIAVHPDYHRRGLGEALLRWALAWFREQGLKRATLTVNTDNAPAIALYRKLGFAPGEMGFDYRRPIDEDEVRQVLERRRAQHIRVKRRY